MSRNTILVTGGAGFIGSELTRQLCETKNHIVVVDNLVNARRENLEGLPVDQVQLVVTDIRDQDRMTRLLYGVKVVYHLACLGVRHSIHAPEENHAVNATATLQLLKLAREAGVSRFVCVSSSEVYGTARWTPMNEDHPTYPMTVYGASKLAGECYTRAFYRTYGYSTVVIRPFNTYGPRSHHEGDSGEVIPKFLLRAMTNHPLVIFGDGRQTRDFTYVSDTARGILLAGFSDQAIGETINLGYGAEISINDLAQRIVRLLNKPNVPIMYDAPRPGDTLQLYADTTKAKKLLGYEPHVNLDEGLQKLSTWYSSLGISPEILLKNEEVHNWQPGERQIHDQ